MIRLIHSSEVERDWIKMQELYSGDLNNRLVQYSGDLKSRNIWNLDFLKVGFQMVGL